MTCSERFLLSQARYGVLHVLYIVFFSLLSFGGKACASDGQNVRRIENNQK